jgi:O-antigen ligase
VSALPLPLIILGLCGVVAVAGIWCLRDPQRAFLMVIFTTPFVANPSRDPLFMRIGLPEIVFVFFAFVWLWSMAIQRRRFRRLQAVHMFSLLLLLVAVFSFVGADEAGFSMATIEVVILGYLVVFCIIADQFLSSDGDIRKVLDVWMLAATVVAVIGLYECVAVVVGLPRINAYKDAYRVIGTFRRPPQLGVYALSTFFVAVAYSVVPDMSMRKRLALRILAVAMVVLIVFSSRRSALAALAAGMFLILVLNAANLRRAMVLGGVFALAVFGAYQLVISDPTLRDFFGNRLRVLYSPGTEGIPFVRENFEQAVAAFRDKPFLGIGYGHFARSEYSGESQNEIHSTPLRVMAECGIAGSLAYVLMTVAFLYLAWRNVGLARGTIWASFTQVLFPALVALQVSYMYNRALRDRTYWLLIAMVVAFNRILVAHREEERAALAWESEEAQEGEEPPESPAEPEADVGEPSSAERPRN